ncbi:MAG TPA: metallophosphoesterase [Acidobacteriaceae bacterium]|nr:metallophosphoesterase [Acidobacteriaceae bacterium]
MRSCLAALPGLALLVLALVPGLAPAQTALLSQPGPTFTVPDSVLPKNFSFIVYGDTRFTDPADIQAADPSARRALVAKIAQIHPDALIITGDLPYRGTYPADYGVYEKETTAWHAERLRIYPVLGNHELGGHGPDSWLTDWWNTFPELKDRRWYSVAFGSHVYFLCLDSNSALTPGSEQRQWLEDQVAHLSRKVEFVVVALHHPPVADIQTLIEVDHNPRPNEISLRDYLSSIAPHTHAQIIVAAGHIHNYERASVDGVTYLVSGGGGAHPYPVVRTSQDEYQATEFPNFHYILFQLQGKQLHATMTRLAFPIADPPQWEAKDTFTITAK